jgi:hypothetical protein
VAPVVVHLGDPSVPSITPQEAELAEQLLKARWLNPKPSPTKSFFRSERISRIREQLAGPSSQDLDLAVYEYLCRTSIPLGLLQHKGPVATTWTPVLAENYDELLASAGKRPVRFSPKAVQHIPYLTADEPDVDVALDRFSNVHLLRTAANTVARIVLFERGEAPPPEGLSKDFTNSRRLMALCEVVKTLDYSLNAKSYQCVYASFVSNEFVRTAKAENIVPKAEFWMPHALAEKMQTPWFDRENWIEALRREPVECLGRWSSLAEHFLSLSTTILDGHKLAVAYPLGQIMRGGEPVWVYFGPALSAAQILIIMSIAAKTCQHVEIW